MGDLLFVTKDFTINGDILKKLSKYSLSLAQEMQRSMIIARDSNQSAKDVLEQLVIEIDSQKLMSKAEVVATKLTFEEVIALKAYASCLFVKINEFLEKLYTDLKDEYLGKEKTWAMTVKHIYSAM